MLLFHRLDFFDFGSRVDRLISAWGYHGVLGLSGIALFRGSFKSVLVAAALGLRVRQLRHFLYGRVLDDVQLSGDIRSVAQLLCLRLLQLGNGFVPILMGFLKLTFHCE